MRSLQQLIVDYVETLKTEAHTLGNHGLSEEEFYASGLFRGAIERARGSFQRLCGEKRICPRRSQLHAGPKSN